MPLGWRWGPKQDNSLLITLLCLLIRRIPPPKLPAWPISISLSVTNGSSVNNFPEVLCCKKKQPSASTSDRSHNIGEAVSESARTSAVPSRLLGFLSNPAETLRTWSIPLSVKCWKDYFVCTHFCKLKNDTDISLKSCLLIDQLFKNLDWFFLKND